MLYPFYTTLIDAFVPGGEAEADAGKKGAGRAGGESTAPPRLLHSAAALRPRLRAATGVEYLLTCTY